MPYRNRIRLPLYISKPQFPSERNVFRKADGSSKVLSMIIRNTYAGTTDYLPENWHRKLIVALSHDEVQIENTRYLTDIVLDSEYQIEWQDFKDYPVAQAKFTVQSTPFSATNSNCQTCEEATQLNLADDTYPGTLAEGSTNNLTVTTNDIIVCYPYTLSVTTFNTTYLVSAVINAAGLLTIVLKTPISSGTNILMATYRATCSDGSYDEANVYATVTGTAAGCNPPSNIVISAITGNAATATWTAASPAPANGYVWNLYFNSLPFQTGTTNGLTVNLINLVQANYHVFGVSSNCGATVSTEIQAGFTTTGTNKGCGSFSFIHFDTSQPYRTFSYIDCNGNMVNVAAYSGINYDFCALIDNSSPTTPYYFSSGASNSTLTYIGLC